MEEFIMQYTTYVERANELTPVEALTILTDAYMAQCGISLTYRTLVEGASWYWQELLGESDHELAKIAKKKTFTGLMPFLSGEFNERKEHYWEYDICNLDSDDAVDAAMSFLDDYEDDRLRIAFCRGIIYYIEQLKIYEVKHDEILAENPHLVSVENQNLMTYSEFEEMVRNRPTPDPPSYYRLEVWSYENMATFSREVVNDTPTYRRPISRRQADFATKDEALLAMQGIIDSVKDNICVFNLERLPFRVFDKKSFWLEAWTYDAEGHLIQEAPCSASHYHKAGVFGKFFGHLPEKVKWHVGDIVQIFHRYFGDYRTFVTLGIVAEEPKDTHEGYDAYVHAAKQWIKDGNNPDDWLDITNYAGTDEDEMFTQFGPYNEDCRNFTFNNPMHVLPAPDNLPEEVKAELRSWHADWLRNIEDM